MKGFFDKKSPEGGGYLAIAVFIFVLYTLAKSDDLLAAMDVYFSK